MTTQNLRDTYWPMVSARYPNSHKPQLEEAIGKLADVFAVVCFRGDAAKAQTDLKRHLRDHVTFERNTVWRDMVAIERKATGAHIEKATAPTGKLPWYVRYREPVCLLAALVVFLCALWIPIFPDDQPEKQNCLALLAVASVLWSTEALPLFVTSMLVPALAVLLRVLVDRSGDQPVRMTAQDAAPAIFHAMFSQVR